MFLNEPAFSPHHTNFTHYDFAWDVVAKSRPNSNGGS